MPDNIIDLRDLADNWHDEVEELNERTKESASYGELIEVESRYWQLCDDLGIEKTPDALAGFANDYEPTLIAKHYFVEYAQELANDIAPFSRDGEVGQVLDSWPYRCIDWEQAARELRHDYTTVRFDGDDYYIRSW